MSREPTRHPPVNAGSRLRLSRHRRGRDPRFTESSLIVITVLLGPDRFLVKTALDELLQSNDPSGFNTALFDAEATPASELISAVSTPPFLGPVRMVAINNLLSISRNQRDRDLDEIVASLQPGVHLILVDPSLSSLPAAAKKSLPIDTHMRSSAPPRGNDLREFTQARFNESGTRIESTALIMVLDRLFPGTWQRAAGNPAFDKPPDLQRLHTEIDKLVTAANDGLVTVSLVEALVALDHEERMFSFQDAILRGDKRAAVHELSQIPVAGDEAPRILAQLYQQIEYARAAVSAGQPTDPLEAGKALGMTNPNRMKAVQRSVARPAAYFDALLNLALESDRRVKSGTERDPRSALCFIVEHLPESTGNPEARAPGR